VDEQLARLQCEIDKLTGKINLEEVKPKSDLDHTGLAAWRKEKEQLRDERLLLLQRQQHSPAARSSDLAIQRIEKKLNIMDGRQVSIEGK
jgi:hypothetical protein